MAEADDPVARDVLARWHEAIADGDLALLDALLHPDVVFRSPVVHRPVEGRDMTRLYLAGAHQVLVDGRPFTYVRQLVDARDAMLEFTTDLDGTQVHGVDLLAWDDDGHLTAITVMVRPRRAMAELHRRMGELLAAASGDAAPATAAPAAPAAP